MISSKLWDFRNVLMILGEDDLLYQSNRINLIRETKETVGNEYQGKLNSEI